MGEEISQEKQKPGMHGCLKGCLVFLAVCVVGFVVTVAVVYHKREALKNWAVEKTFSTMEKAFLEKMPEDIDKEKVTETLGRFRTAILEGDFSEKDLEKVMSEFQNVMEDRKLDADEINHLLKVFDEMLTEKAAGD